MSRVQLRDAAILTRLTEIRDLDAPVTRRR